MNRGIWQFFIIFCICSCWIQSTLWAQPFDCHKPISFGNASFEELKFHVETCGLDSIESVISSFEPRMLKRYVALFDSRSLHDASPLYPRIVLLSNGLFVAFNGHPSQAHYYDLEMIQYRSDTSKFEMRTIHFPTEIERSQGVKPKTSEANPPLCLSCHGINPRPIWDAYHFWPGAYGQDNDEFHPKENALFANFIQNKNLVDRYKSLPDRLTDYSRINDNFGAAISYYNYQKIAHEILSYKKLEPYHYALVGSLLCSVLDDIEYGDSASLKWKAEDFLPPEIKKRFAKNFSQVMTETQKGHNESLLSRLNRIKDLSPEIDVQDLIDQISNGTRHGGNENFSTSVAAFRYIYEGLGYEMRGWSNEFNPGYYSFNDGRYGILSLIYWIVKDSPVFKKDNSGLSFLDHRPARNLFEAEESRQDFLYNNDKHPFTELAEKRDLLCPLLKEKSLKALNSLTFKEWLKFVLQ
jgi:hypothetical protein